MNLFIDKKNKEKNNTIKKLFQSLLLKDESSKIAKSYLEKRGISNDLIEKFEIGWCPKSLEEKLPRERKFLAGGIVFPIVSEYNDTIAFSRRLPLDADKLPEGALKWFNESYVKTQYLYGFNNALEHIIKNDSVIIVEGQGDAITCFGNGLKNCVATMGPALTKEHIIKLSRFTNNFILMFDGDTSGRAASNRTQKIIKSLGCGKLNFKDVNLTANGKDYDPDSFIRNFGAKKLILHIKKLEKNKSGDI